MLKLKKVAILLVILFALMAVMGVTVKATSNTALDLNNYLTTPDTNQTTTNEATTGNVALNTTTNTSTGGSVVQPETNSSESENNLPQTGVTEDITVMFFIIVCVISAVYAYKKIRDYKN